LPHTKQRRRRPLGGGAGGPGVAAPVGVLGGWAGARPGGGEARAGGAVEGATGASARLGEGLEGAGSDGSGGGEAPSGGPSLGFPLRHRLRIDDIPYTEGHRNISLPGRPTRFWSPDRSEGVATTPSEQLARRSIVLPSSPKPSGVYAPVVVEGGLATVSGQIVTQGGVAVHPGVVDRDVDPADARELARRATLQALSALDATLGSIDRVRRVVRLAVYVASSPGFTRHHEVANGASELLIEIFGEAGRPARVAMGVVALPLNAPVEVELTVAIS